MIGYKRQIAMMCAVVGSAVLAALAPPAGAVQLGQRYTDQIHGFSLRPPQDSSRQRESTGSRLVAWFNSDEQTGTLQWALSVHEAVDPNEKTRLGDVELEDYAKRLAAQLHQDQNYNIDTDSIRLLNISDRPAIHFQGRTMGGVPMYRRQAWVLAESNRFLLLQIQGPEDSKSRLDEIFQTVLKTVKVTDPRSLEQIRRGYHTQVQAGEQLLESLEPERIVTSLQREPQWFVMKYNGEPVGWMARIEGREARQRRPGLFVKTYAMVEMPDAPVRVMKRNMWSSFDRQAEEWTERLQIGGDKRAQVIKTEGVLTGGTVVSSTLQGGQTTTKQNPAPEGIYLPKAYGEVLPRLVNRSGRGTYSLATYDASTGKMNMRTIKVVGRQEIRMGGKRVKSIYVTDQPHFDAEATKVWVDQKGRLLRTRTGDGLELGRSNRQIVQRIFPKATAIIQALK
ncbi:MAG: hypothetical protein ACOC93_04495 [Planctomycetota bacterium]